MMSKLKYIGRAAGEIATLFCASIVVGGGIACGFWMVSLVLLMMD
ncbi:MAG: hypothetical protein Q4C52_13020 [Eubacteriales bacterium]|nr:hypothetical protein [Eubacteriales bacterium]